MSNKGQAIGFLGYGTIASALLQGSAKSQLDQGHCLMVSERSESRSLEIVQAYPAIKRLPNQDLLDASDVIVLGTTADQARELLPQLDLKPGQRVISLMARIDAHELQGLIAPAQFDTNLIPFPVASYGQCPLLCAPASSLAQDLFGGSQHVIGLENQSQMHKFLCAQALLSPLLQQLHDTTQWLGEQTGEPQKAESFLRALVGRSLSAAPLDQPGVLAQMLEDLSTPGGYNATLRDHLDQSGAYRSLVEGLDRLDRDNAPG